jgi:hypothetical protein
MQSDNEVPVTKFRGRYLMTTNEGILRELPFGSALRRLDNGTMVANVGRTIHNEIPDTRMYPVILIRQPDGTISPGFITGYPEGGEIPDPKPVPVAKPNPPPRITPMENRMPIRIAVASYFHSRGQNVTGERLSQFIRDKPAEVENILSRRRSDK